MEKYIPCKPQKRTGLAKLILEQIVTRGNEGHYILIKGSLYQKYIIKYIYLLSNRALRYMKQNLTKLKD